jgi:hypothetical protein
MENVWLETETPLLYNSALYQLFSYSVFNLKQWRRMIMDRVLKKWFSGLLLMVIGFSSEAFAQSLSSPDPASPAVTQKATALSSKGKGKRPKVLKGKIVWLDLVSAKPQVKITSTKTGKARSVYVSKSTVFLKGGSKVDASQLKIGDAVKIIKKKKKNRTAKSIEIL